VIRPVLQNQTWAAPEQLWLSTLLAVVLHIVLLGLNGLQPQSVDDEMYFPLESLSEDSEGPAPENAVAGLVDRAANSRDQAAELLLQAKINRATEAGEADSQRQQQWLQAATANPEVKQMLLAREAPMRVYYQTPSLHTVAEAEADRVPQLQQQAAAAISQADNDADSARLLTVGAGSRQDVAVQYVESWRRWMRANGNLFYPAEARRLGLRGDVLTRVRLNSDGSLADVRILKSSGQRLLDQAVLQTTREARWFLPFPAELAQQYDQLEFSWRWRYGSRS